MLELIDSVLELIIALQKIGAVLTQMTAVNRSGI